MSRRALALAGAGALGWTAAALISPVPTGAAVAPVAAVARVAAVGAVAPRGHELCRIADRRIREASGALVSRADPHVVIVQNDSGNTPQLFGVDTAAGCVVRWALTVRGVRNVDWEDLAPGRDAHGRPLVLIGDIGDNDATRDSIVVYAVPEPAAAARGELVAPPVATYPLRYPDHAHDAETLLALPDGSLGIVTKNYLGQSSVFVDPAPLRPSRLVTLRRLGYLHIPDSGSTGGPVGSLGRFAVTGGTLSPHGGRVVLRTYTDAWQWPLTGSDLGTALLRHPATRIPIPEQPQGEGVAATPDGRLVLTSEGIDSAVDVVPLPPLPESARRLLPAPTAASSAPASAAASTPSARPDAGDATKRSDLRILAPAVLAALAVAGVAAAAVSVRRRRWRR